MDIYTKIGIAAALIFIVFTIAIVLSAIILNIYNLRKYIIHRDYKHLAFTIYSLILYILMFCGVMQAFVNVLTRISG